ncbi:MAG: gamma-glutamylcyclotransferase [Elainellaceae cyanobacterium]
MANSKSADRRVRVFVYGTLKPGESNYQRYCAGRILRHEEAIAYGQLFDLPMGYPAMTPGSSPVHGVVLEFDDSQLLDILDELEDYDPHRPAAENEYERVELEVFTPQNQALGKAWTYLMTEEQAERWGGQIIPTGNWNSRLSSFLQS